MKWEDIYGTRITPDKELPLDRQLLSYNGSEVFCEGTLSTIVGQAKSKKTFALSLLLEQMLKPSIAGFKSDFCDEILYFDTEQADRRIQQISRRFSSPELITFIPIRQYSIADRYNIIEQGIERIKPSLVVIDGYKELTLDINDQGYSTKLTNKLLQWTTEHKTHICGVLHTNPGSVKPRGALGTELCNKSSLVMHVEPRGPKSRISTLYSRDKEVDPIVFHIDSNGKPVIG